MLTVLFRWKYTSRLRPKSSIRAAQIFTSRSPRNPFQNKFNCFKCCQHIYLACRDTIKFLPNHSLTHRLSCSEIIFSRLRLWTTLSAVRHVKEIAPVVLSAMSTKCTNSICCKNYYWLSVLPLTLIQYSSSTVATDMLQPSRSSLKTSTKLFHLPQEDSDLSITNSPGFLLSFSTSSLMSSFPTAMSRILRIHCSFR